MIGTKNIQYAGAGGDYKRSTTARQWGALIGSGALAIYGFRKRSPLAIALAAGGGAVAYIRINQSSERQQRDASTSTSVLINCTPQEAYQFWRDFENLARFMQRIEEVRIIDNKRSRWTALGPLGRRIHWDAEITEEREGEYIAWRSLPGSDVQIDGRVEFHPALADRGTMVSAHVKFSAPIRGGSTFARFLSKGANFIMRQDLRRLEALIETGEIPTTEGQSHGPRDRITAVLRVVDPSSPIHPESRLSEVLEGRRRVS
jgi:uncharacterized membrane protein